MQVNNQIAETSLPSVEDTLNKRPYNPPKLTQLFDGSENIAGSNTYNERENSGGLLIS